MSRCNSRRKLIWFGHVTRYDSLSKTILQGTSEGGRCRGRHRKCWMGNIKEWTSLPLPELLTQFTQFTQNCSHSGLLQKILEKDLS